MIADDEVFNLEAIKGMLKILGFRNIKERIVCCFNGEDLVAKVREALKENDPKRYPLILTDCSMPFMDGYDAAAEIRHLFKRRRANFLK